MEEIKSSIKVEPEIHLWCVRCQQGLDGNKYKVGEQCPLCKQLAKIGQISENAIAQLQNTEEYVAKRLKNAELIKEMRAAGKVNFIDTNNDNRIKQLENQVASLIEQLKSKK